LGGRLGKGVGGCTGGLSRDGRLEGGSKVTMEWRVNWETRLEDEMEKESK